MGSARLVLRALAVAAGFTVIAGIAAVPAHANGPQSVSALAATLSPAVVNISSSKFVTGGLTYPDSPDDSLQQFFDDANPNKGEGEPQMQEATSLGSGFIIDKSGIVITNNHVIDGADDVEVYLTDGTRLPAKVIGADTKTDLAVLQVQAGHDLPFVELGDSDTALVGDWVMAIGNPFGLGGSVSLGIVSARNRDIQSGPYDEFIQTDAAINQGNSGGPLFDMNGKVVGINTAIIARGGSSLGIGFAVPVNLARPVIDQLRQFGETRRGWLGVGIQDVTEDIAASLGLSDTHGALVVDVTKGGPSEGEIKEGDIITAFDGKPIDKMRDLPRVVAETAVGKAVPVTILRDGTTQVLTIKLGRLESGEQTVNLQQLGEATPAPPGSDDSDLADATPPALSDLVGFDVAVLDDALRAKYGLPPESNGIVVTQVTSGSDADRKGIIAGFRVTEVNQKPVTSVDDVTSLVGDAREAGRPAVLFKVIDPVGTSRFVAVKLG